MQTEVIAYHTIVCWPLGILISYSSLNYITISDGFRFPSDISIRPLNSKDTGDQREASALRDEVWYLYPSISLSKS